MRVMSSHYHTSVLLRESIGGLAVKPDGVYVDLTFGGGGHSKALLDELGESGKLFAFDQDEEAWENAPDDNRFTLVRQNFRFLKNNLRLYGFPKVDGVLADLGVSSHQFDKPERGFSIRFDAELDMRMNKHSDKTAKHILNEYEESDLKKLFFVYGDLKNAGKVARNIVQARSRQKINRVEELKQVLEPLTPSHKWHSFLAKVFQALRIEVNDEMKVLEEMLLQCEDVIKPGGRLVVIAYHSLEDRMVKHLMRSGNLSGKVEKDFYGNMLRPFKPLSSKPIVPTDEEIENNNRARSARLRIAERLAESNE